MLIIKPKLSFILEGFQVFTHKMEDSTIQFCRSFRFQEFFYVFFFKMSKHMMSWCPWGLWTVTWIGWCEDVALHWRRINAETSAPRCSVPLADRDHLSLSWSGKGNFNFHSENDDDKQQGSKLETTPCLVSRLLLLPTSLSWNEGDPNPEAMFPCWDKVVDFLGAQLLEIYLDGIWHLKNWGASPIHSRDPRRFAWQVFLGLLHLHCGHVIHRDRVWASASCRPWFSMFFSAKDLPLFLIQSVQSHRDLWTSTCWMRNSLAHWDYNPACRTWNLRIFSSAWKQKRWLTVAVSGWQVADTVHKHWKPWAKKWCPLVCENGHGHRLWCSLIWLTPA